MTKIEAMNILNMSIFTHAILKQAYVKACFKFHPDRNPGGLEMMKAVNLAYTFLKGIEEDDQTFTPGTDTGPECYGDILNAAINAVVGMEGVIIEICGSWVWLSGNTRLYKDAIKQAGYFWSPKKSMWYFKPSDTATKRKYRGTASIDQIRSKYGSETVSTKAYARVS